MRCGFSKTLELWPNWRHRWKQLWGHVYDERRRIAHPAVTATLEQRGFHNSLPLPTLWPGLTACEHPLRPRA